MVPYKNRGFRFRLGNRPTTISALSETRYTKIVQHLTNPEDKVHLHFKAWVKDRKGSTIVNFPYSCLSETFTLDSCNARGCANAYLTEDRIAFSNFSWVQKYACMFLQDMCLKLCCTNTNPCCPVSMDNNPNCQFLKNRRTPRQRHKK